MNINKDQIMNLENIDKPQYNKESADDNILFSILLPVYNNSADVLNAIRSVINQTISNWELIIIDDCSTDNTYELLSKFVNENPNLKIVLLRNTKNIGLFPSLNEGLLKSNGKYIARIDSDDIFANNILEVHLQFFNENNSYLVTRSKYLREGREPKFGNITMIYNKQIIDKIGYYDSVRFAADDEFSERVGKYYKIIHIDKLLYFAKLRENSLTTSKITGNRKIRIRYVKDYKNWHKKYKNNYMPYPLLKRPFEVDPIMLP